MKVAIVGCGWVGYRLARFLKDRNHTVIATTTTPEKLPELQKVASEAYLFSFDEQTYPEAPDHVDALIFSMPVSKESWVQGFKKSEIHAPKTLFFSSTGIYPQQSGVFTEAHTSNLRNDIFAAENTVKEKFPDSLIMRLGGIMGDERSLANFFNKREVPHPHKKVNHIHFEDILHVTEMLLTSTDAAGTYNIVAPEHPTVAEVLALQKPETDIAEQTNDRIISPERLLKEFNYTFKHPNPKYF